MQMAGGGDGGHLVYIIITHYVRKLICGSPLIAADLNHIIDIMSQFLSQFFAWGKPSKKQQQTNIKSTPDKKVLDHLGKLGGVRVLVQVRHI